MYTLKKIKPLFILMIGLLFIFSCAFAEGVANDLADPNIREIEDVEGQNVDSQQDSENETATQTEVEEIKPWENSYISDEGIVDEKLHYYKKLPDQKKKIGKGRLVELLKTELPNAVVEDLKYTQYQIGTHYFLNLGSVVNVRATPHFKAPIRVKKYRYQRMSVDAVVEGEYSNKSASDRWYRVYWMDKDVKQYGYVFAPIVHKREFQLDKMIQAAELLKKEIDTYSTAYISNYKNRNGWAPRYKGGPVDEYGSKREQAAPAYFQEADHTEFRYMTDGTLLSVHGETEDAYKVTVPGHEGMYFVPKKYVSFKNAIDSLNKVVIVDRKNQNEILLEHDGQKWNLVSRMLATTGVKAEHKEETDLGNFMVVEKKSKFLYLDDITKEISGYAPFAIRFNGGAYVHGVPVNFKMVKETRILQPAVLDEFGGVIVPEVTEEVVVDRIDPGHAEYLSTIGTTPRSHKCVRNYTSHAKFVYNWAEVGQTAVIVIE